MSLTVEPVIQRARPGTVKLGGVLGQALEANRVGRLSKFIVDENSPAIALFAPEAVARNREGDWYGEHAGKWLIAATRAAVRAGDDELLDRVQKVADYLIDRQDADGYLGNYAPDRRFMRPQPPKLQTWDGAPSVRTWDIWTHSYLILGMIELYRAVKADRYLGAARRIADLCLRTLSQGATSITDLGNHFGLSATVLLDPAVELFAETGDNRYLDLARLIVEQAEAEPRNRFLTMALAGADPSEIATGKAYQLLWNVVGLAKLYRATGNADYLTAARNVWTAVRAHHLTLGGGPWGGVAHRSREVFNAPEAFDPQGYVETCSIMAWVQLNRELLMISGDAAFAQEIERSAYNDLLGAQAPNGEDWCYYSFPNGRRVHTTYWRCCKSSGAMALEELPEIAYGLTHDGGIAINLLGPSTALIDLPGQGRVGLRQQTEYPRDGRLRVEVSPEKEAAFPLLIRIPDWVEKASLEVGQHSVPAQAGEYARIERVWRPGDAIELDLPMRPQVHRAVRRSVQSSIAPDGQPVDQEVLHDEFIAVSRGPLVYATRLIDGFKRAETLRFSKPPTATAEADTITLEPEGRAPIVFEPYFSVADREDRSWHLTWLGLDEDREVAA